MAPEIWAAFQPALETLAARKRQRPMSARRNPLSWRAAAIYAHEDTTGRYYTFEGTGRLEPLLAGTVLPRALVTPAGSARLWRPEFRGLVAAG